MNSPKLYDFSPQLINRRNFLINAAAAGTFALAGGPRHIAAASMRRDPRRFALVKVSRDRVIREVVGLRPFREEGYVVEAHRIGTKLLIHNYGHGGGGITMSWGTANEAVELVRGFQPPVPGRTKGQAQRRFAVIGCGVVGLSTAILLQKRFQDGPGTVTIYSKDLPPDTTSNIAGGYWSPTSIFDDAAVTPKFIERFRASARYANRSFQLLAGSEYGVRWIDTYQLFRSKPAVAPEFPGGNALYPAQGPLSESENPFAFPYVHHFSTMLIEPSIYLNRLLRDFYAAGGKLIVKEFRSRDEVMRLPEPVILNCTGLGSRQLFGDEKLIPVRGQLEVLLPQPEVDYCYLGPGYMFPRSDGIVLGGTFDRGDSNLTVDPEQATQILNSHTAIMRGLKQPAQLASWSQS